MARVKKNCNSMSEEAVKDKNIHVRANLRDIIKINQIAHKMGYSKSEVFRLAINELHKKLFSDE